MTPTGPPTFDGSAGKWYTPITVAATGDICGADPGIKNAAGATPASPPDNIPLQPPVNVTPAPNICGDGSCYNPNNQDFCAAGGSPCIPAASGDGPGGCNTVGDITICAGAPTAPTPSVASVPDPPAQIQSNDGYNQANPTTGAPIHVQVPVYSTGAPLPGGAGTNNPGSTTGPASSGTSSSPASASSAGKGTYGGGTDCKTPPACTGDAVECGAATTQWGTTCEVNTDLAGTGPPSDLTALESKYSQGDVWITPSTGNTVGDSANAGHYDSSGFGYGTTCPAVDVSFDLLGATVTAPLSVVCPFGVLIRAIVIGFATVSAVIITWGGRNG